MNIKYKKELLEAAAELISGKIITIPTDTFYGLACDATNAEAVEELFKIKERGLNKPVPILIADSKEEIDSYCSEKNLEILNRPKYVDPTMICHHFIWVGKRPRPAQWKIS